MNMMITEVERQHQNHLSVKARLYGGKRGTVERLDNVEEQIAMAERRQQRLEHRVEAQAKQIANLIKSLLDAKAKIEEQGKRIRKLIVEHNAAPNSLRPVQQIASEILKDYPGVTWKDIIGVRRSKHLIEPRYKCMNAVYQERYDLSLPVMGRIFKRDHSVILIAVGRYGKRRSEVVRSERERDAA